MTRFQAAIEAVNDKNRQVLSTIPPKYDSSIYITEW
jgi:hypothetical protein